MHRDDEFEFQRELSRYDLDLQQELCDAHEIGWLLDELADRFEAAQHGHAAQVLPADALGKEAWRLLIWRTPTEVEARNNFNPLDEEIGLLMGEIAVRLRYRPRTPGEAA